METPNPSSITDARNVEPADDAAKTTTETADATDKAGEGQAGARHLPNPFSWLGGRLRDAFGFLREQLTSAFSRLRNKKKGYWRRQAFHWGGVALSIIIGINVGHFLEHHRVWLRERYHLTQLMHELTHRISGKTPYAKNTVVVLIDDEEFWGEKLAHRNPVNREYLAQLIESVERFNPRVIALDFYLSSPRPDGSVVEHPNYQAETDALIGTVCQVGARRSVILLKSVGFKDGYYVYESDVYKPEIFAGLNVNFGHVHFEHDYRLIPLSVTVLAGEEGEQLDSFAEAIARAFDMSGNAFDFDRGDGKAVTYGEYLHPDKINRYPAHRIRTATPGSAEFAEMTKKIVGKIVIIGGSWHKQAFKRGALSDQHSTPVGDIPGVFMHANYVEALLDTRYYRPLPKAFLLILEILLGVVTAMLVAREHLRLVWKLLLLVGLVLLLMLLSIISLQLLGSFFDFFIPVVMVLAHALIEQANDWRKQAGQKDTHAHHTT